MEENDPATPALITMTNSTPALGKWMSEAQTPVRKFDYLPKRATFVNFSKDLPSFFKPVGEEDEKLKLKPKQSAPVTIRQNGGEAARSMLDDVVPSTTL